MKRIGWLVMALLVAFAMPAAAQAQALGYMMQRAQIVEVKDGGVLTVQGLCWLLIRTASTLSTWIILRKTAAALMNVWWSSTCRTK